MRIGIVVIGIILLISGLLLYVTGNEIIAQIEAYNVGGIPISEFIMFVRPDIKKQYEMAQAFIIVGGILGVIGFLVCISGISISKQKILKNDQNNTSTKIVGQKKHSDNDLNKKEK